MPGPRAARLLLHSALWLPTSAIAVAVVAGILFSLYGDNAWKEPPGADPLAEPACLRMFFGLRDDLENRAEAALSVSDRASATRSSWSEFDRRFFERLEKVAMRCESDPELAQAYRTLRDLHGHYRELVADFSRVDPTRAELDRLSDRFGRVRLNP